jgi:hypothetical protein
MSGGLSGPELGSGCRGAGSALLRSLPLGAPVLAAAWAPARGGVWKPEPDLRRGGTGFRLVEWTAFFSGAGGGRCSGELRWMSGAGRVGEYGLAGWDFRRWRVG